MASAKKCDRCGKFYTVSGLGFETIIGLSVYIGIEQIDLCDDCQKFIKNAIRNFGKEEENGISG